MPPKKKVKAPELDVVLDDPLHGVKRVRGSRTYNPKNSRLVCNACFYSDGACDETTEVGGKRKSTPAGSASAELPLVEWPSMQRTWGLR